jgi:hypothetical protein
MTLTGIVVQYIQLNSRKHYKALLNLHKTITYIYSMDTYPHYTLKQ